MRLLRFLVPLLFLIFPAAVFSQVNYSGEVNLQGMYSTGEKLPFWMYNNQRGRISENTNVAGWLSGRMNYEVGYDGIVEFGAGILFLNERRDQVFLDEIYAHFENSRFYITVGRKQQKELYNGLSASNRSILWSLNTRPVPGLQIGTNGPLFPFDPENASGFGFEGSWNEYVLEEERNVRYAKLHHKNLLLVYRSKNNFEVRAGVQHFVQWGGNSRSVGPQPETFDDYLRVVSGRNGIGGARESDLLNALGNHIGGYEIFVKKTFREFNIELLYNHLFEDGSGRRLGNTPDGRYGVFYKTKDNDRIINSFIYELYYTHHQSNTTTGIDKFDDYFNNTGYRSGWTYENRILGAPFFTVDPDGEGIINNKFTAHHIGVGGVFSNYFVSYPYKLLLSYAHNDGRYKKRFRPKQDVGYIYSEFGLMRSWVDLDLQFGAEYNSYDSPIYGVGVNVSYKF